MKFSDLFSFPRNVSPLEEQMRIRDGLADVAKANRVRIFCTKDKIGKGRRVLVGVTDYTKSDFEMLDAICDSKVFDQIDIFLLWSCNSQQDINEYVPDVAPVYHSPVVGIWDDGNLVEKASGHNARQMVQSILSSKG